MTMIMIVHPNNHDPDDHDTYQARTLAVVHIFNDPIAVLFFNAAVTKSKKQIIILSSFPHYHHQVNLYLDDIWTLGSVFFSLGETTGIIDFKKIILDILLRSSYKVNQRDDL